MAFGRRVCNAIRLPTTSKLPGEAESNMASAQEQENVLRRRTKTHGNHGFFTPVEEKFPQVRFAEPLVNMVPTQTVEKYMPTIRIAVTTAFWIGATLAILGPLIIVGSIAVQGIQGYCRMLPYPTAVCNSAWIRPQQYTLHSMAAGRTPVTTILEELGALNDMTASLTFIGLPLHTVVTNLTGVLSELESTMDTEQFRKSENIGNVAGKAHNLAESFSASDNAFRMQTAWEPHGITDLSQEIEELAAATNGSMKLITTLTEGVYHTLPYFSKRSLSYSLVVRYHNMISTNYSSEVESLVLEVTETRLALQDLLGEVGQLYHLLLPVAPAQADDMVMIRYATQWALAIIQTAENHYKSMYNSLRALSLPLATDVASYDSWWSSKSGLSGSQLLATVQTERKQIGQVMATAEEAQRVLDELFDGYMEDEQASIDIRHRVEAAAVEGRMQWA